MDDSAEASRYPVAAMHTGFRLFAVMAALATVAFPVAAEIDGQTFTSEEWRVEVTGPRNWQLSAQTSYPRILVWMTSQTGKGRILFSAERPDRPVTALVYAERSIALLKKLQFGVGAPKLHPTTGAYWVDFDDGRSFLRQAYVVRNGHVYVLTLAATSNLGRNQYLRSFDSALRSIRFIEPTPEPPPTDEDGDESSDDAPEPPKQ